MNSTKQTNQPAATNGQQITLAAHRKLSALAFPQLKTIVCEFHEGNLTLRGKVNSFFLRQMAYAAVKHVAGVEEVCDRLEVVHPRTNAI